PSFLISVRTRSSDGIEPVDSLQTLFDQRKNCQLINNLSTSPSLETAIRLHPNPSSQQLYINHSHPSPLQLQVFDSSGRLHQQQSLRFTERLSTDQWPNGMYYLQFSTDQQSWTTKIVIHH
ncbi:MAG: T9SS type A sorting domain-containing protein, partial [Bacteroidota bacterium]